MSMPDHADVWETTDTVVMEKPRPRQEARDEQEPSDEDPRVQEPALLS